MPNIISQKSTRKHPRENRLWVCMSGTLPLFFMLLIYLFILPSSACLLSSTSSFLLRQPLILACSAVKLWHLVKHDSEIFPRAHFDCDNYRGKHFVRFPFPPSYKCIGATELKYVALLTCNNITLRLLVRCSFFSDGFLAPIQSSWVYSYCCVFIIILWCILTCSTCKGHISLIPARQRQAFPEQCSKPNHRTQSEICSVSLSRITSNEQELYFMIFSPPCPTVCLLLLLPDLQFIALQNFCSVKTNTSAYLDHTPQRPLDVVRRGAGCGAEWHRYWSTSAIHLIH